MTLWQVDVGYACGGIVLDGYVVVESAPIFRWMIGKTRNQVRGWVWRKGGTVTQV